MASNNDKSISQEKAKLIYQKFLQNELTEEFNDAKIISIIGSWGTGKSTIKEELHKLINANHDGKTVTAIYDALQFEVF